MQNFLPILEYRKRGILIAIRIIVVNTPRQTTAIYVCNSMCLLCVNNMVCTAALASHTIHHIPRTDGSKLITVYQLLIRCFINCFLIDHAALFSAATVLCSKLRTRMSITICNTFTKKYRYTDFCEIQNTENLFVPNSTETGDREFGFRYSYSPCVFCHN